MFETVGFAAAYRVWSFRLEVRSSSVVPFCFCLAYFLQRVQLQNHFGIRSQLPYHSCFEPKSHHCDDTLAGPFVRVLSRPNELRFHDGSVSV